MKERKNMTTKILKDYTPASKIDLVKEAIRDFKACFTENDLARMFEETTNIDLMNGEVIKCTVEGFSYNESTDLVSFRIEMIVDSLIGFHRFSFYINNANGGCYSIDNDEILLNHQFYK